MNVSHPNGHITRMPFSTYVYLLESGHEVNNEVGGIYLGKTVKVISRVFKDVDDL